MHQHIVAVPPDTGIYAEVRVVILNTIWIVPEVDRHGGRRRLADQLALLIGHGRALLIVGIDLHPQPGALQLSGVDGQDGTACGKTAIDVRTARDRIEVQIGFDLAIHVLETLRREGRAGLRDLAQGIRSQPGAEKSPPS